jgi:hypothetical protein
MAILEYWRAATAPRGRNSASIASTRTTIDPPIIAVRLVQLRARRQGPRSGIARVSQRSKRSRLEVSASHRSFRVTAAADAAADGAPQPHGNQKPRRGATPRSLSRSRQGAPEAPVHAEGRYRRQLARVHLVDLLRVLLGDRLALELHRRRQLVASWEPVTLDDRELLDLLHAR